MAFRITYNPPSGISGALAQQAGFGQFAQRQQSDARRYALA